MIYSRHGGHVHISVCGRHMMLYFPRELSTRIVLCHLAPGTHSVSRVTRGTRVREENGKVKGHTHPVRMRAFGMETTCTTLISRPFLSSFGARCNYYGPNIINRTSKACAISTSSSSVIFVYVNK